MDKSIWTGIAVVAALLAISWAFSHFGRIGGVIVVLLVIVVGGSFVKPIKTVAVGIIDTCQAPLDAADKIVHGKWK